MRFYWIKDHTEQGQFKIYCQPGNSNTGDYHTKHHSPTHHRLMRPVFLHTHLLIELLSNNLLQGCVNSPKCACMCARRNIAQKNGTQLVFPPSAVHNSFFPHSDKMGTYPVYGQNYQSTNGILDRLVCLSNGKST